MSKLVPPLRGSSRPGPLRPKTVKFQSGEHQITALSLTATTSPTYLVAYLQMTRRVVERTSYGGAIHRRKFPDDQQTKFHKTKFDDASRLRESARHWHNGIVAD